MRKTLLAAIIAATALVPPAAFAQDRGRWGNRDDGQSQNSGERGNRDGRGERQQAPPAAEAEAQAEPQLQSRRSRGDNRGEGGQERSWSRSEADDGQRGNWRQRQPAQQAPQPQTVQPAQVPQLGGGRDQWNGQPRHDRREWNGQQQQWRGGQADGNSVNRDRGWSHRNGANGNHGVWNNDRGNSSRWSNGWRNHNRYDWRGYRNGSRSTFRLPRYYAPSNWRYGYRRFSIGFTLNSILFGRQYWINDPYNYRLPDVYGPYRWVRYYNDALLVDIYTGEVVDTVYDIFW